MAGRERGQPAKRLRGHALDLARGTAEQRETVESGEGALATGLLSLWAHGNIAATTMCWLAHLATLDGVEHEEVAALARAGNFGQVPGNCARDVTRRFCSASRVPEPLQVAIPSRYWTLKQTRTPLKMPGSCCHTWSSAPSQQGTRQSSSLLAWRSSKLSGTVPSQQGTTGSRMYLPSNEEEGRPALHTRGRCGVPVQGHPYGVVSLFSDSLVKQFLMAMFPKLATSASTWPAIMKWLVWSFDALAKGYHPKKRA